MDCFTPERIELGERALEAIARNTLTIPDEKWRMSTFLRHTPCGTVGCALGWGIDLPEVRACGISLVEYCGSFYPCQNDAEPLEDSWEVIGQLFAITNHDAAQMFCDMEYVNPTQAAVSARITAFLSERRAKRVQVQIVSNRCESAAEVLTVGA